MTVKPMGIRLHVEGDAEVIRAFDSIERAGTQAEQAIAAAATRRAAAMRAADEPTRLSLQREHDARQRLMALSDVQLNRQLANAERARRAMAQATSQEDINRVLGVGGSGAGSARASAEAFEAQHRAMEQSRAAAARLRAQMDPVWAAQQRLNTELMEYRQLAQQGAITTREWAAAEAMARRRFDETTAALNRRNAVMVGSGRVLSAGQMRQSRLDLTRQGADVFVTAAMGMSPAMIAIQQGPQILDSLATSGLKASGAVLALGGAVTAVAGGVAALTVAWLQGESAALAYERVTTGVGRTAGLTAERLEALALSAAEAGEISTRAAREQALAYAATGRIGAEVIGGLIEMGKDYASFFGIEAKEATEQLAEAMVSPDKAARDLTRRIGLMDQATLDHIDSLVEQGKQHEAQMILLRQLDGAVSDHAENVGKIESAWDGVARAISNAWDWLGRYLLVTDEEKLERLNVALDQRLDPGTRRAWEAERDALAETIAAREARAEEQRRQAAENQAAQLAQDRRDGQGGGRGGASGAARASRDALRQGRDLEDDQARLDLQIAQIRNDEARLLRLREQEQWTRRLRELEDRGLSTAQARAQVDNERALIDAEREDAALRAIERQQDQVDLERARVLGMTAQVEKLELLADLDRRIAFYVEQRLSDEEALTAALADQTEIQLAQLEARRRLAAEAERDHALTLARLRGDRDLVRELEIADRERAAARRFERIHGLDYGEGDGAGRRIVMAELEAEAEGALRNGIRGMIDELERGGLEAALNGIFDRAANRLGDKLADLLTRWLTQMDGVGGGGGGWLGDAIGWLFGAVGGSSGFSKIGKNAAGTDYWLGGWTWVGEHGKELVELPRGSRIFEHDRSMRMAAGMAGAAGAAPVNLNMPISIRADGADPAQLAALTAEVTHLRRTLPGLILSTVAEGRQRRVPGLIMGVVS